MMLTLLMATSMVGALEPIRLEAELAELKNVRISSEGVGYSGSGFVTDLIPNDIEIRWGFQAKAGLYEVWVGYRTPGGQKGFGVEVNGRGISSMLPASPTFSVHRAGKVELRDGANTAAILRGWGYWDVDYLELRPASAPAALLPVPPKLNHPSPSPEAQALMRRLTEAYGKVMWTGQYEIHEADWVHEQTGKRPMILGVDLMDYSPSRIEFGADPAGTTEKWISAVKQHGYALTLSWHWNAPSGLKNREFTNQRGEKVNQLWYRGFYTDATTFDVEAALKSPESRDYKLLLRDIDAIAVELKKLQAARIPVLWRPLHEAEGRWFWWGAKGPEPCLALWRMMHDRLTKHHGLDNLIWVWNSAEAAWYPGDETVDIVSIDAYPSDRGDPLTAAWEDLLARFNGRKVLAVAEFPGPMDAERAFRFGARWAFAVSWTGDLGPKGSKLEDVRRIYGSSKAGVLRN